MTVLGDSMSKLPSKPTMQVREALDELLQRSDETSGKEVGEMYLGPDIFVALLRRRRVVEGEWETTERTVDLFDLMDQHVESESRVERQRAGRRAGKDHPKKSAE